MSGILYRIFDKGFSTGLAVKNQIRIMLLKNRSEDGDFENTPFSDLYYLEAFTELSFYRAKLLYRIKLLYRTKVNKNLRLYIAAKQGTYVRIWQEIYSSGIGFPCFLERSRNDRGLFRSQKIRRQSL